MLSWNVHFIWKVICSCRIGKISGVKLSTLIVTWRRGTCWRGFFTDKNFHELIWNSCVNNHHAFIFALWKLSSKWSSRNGNTWKYTYTYRNNYTEIENFHYNAFVFHSCLICSPRVCQFVIFTKLHSLYCI